MFKKRLLPVLVAMATGSIPTYAQETSAQKLEDEIVVTGVRNAELNARQSERNKNIFSSVIAQDDAGNFADQNVAESLQRLPGITLQKSEGEGRFVSVRGLGPGFVTVSMNGSELASASTDTRAFALDALPADMLGSIEVFKSLTPDMDLNSIAGRVNVNTVSAFDREKDTLKFLAQGSYQDYSGDYSPKISLQGTNLLFDNTVGIGYTLSYEDRSTEVYEVRHHADDDMTYRSAAGGSVLAPWQFEARQEEAERKRITGSIDFGYRPNETSKYFLRLSQTEFEDMDVALREYYRFDTATGGENVYVDPATGTFGIVDGELQHQYFLQEGTATTSAASIGGENIFNEAWTLDYEYAYSKGEYSKPDGSRVQFRAVDLPMLGRAGKDYIAGQIISPGDMAQLAGVSGALPGTGGYGGTNGYQPGERTQGNMQYDNIFIEDSFRDDTIDQFSVNLRRDFSDGLVNYVKTGFTVKQRDRDRNKDRWSIVPGNYTAGCAGDAECLTLSGARLRDFETYTPNHPDFNYNFITRSETERLLEATYPIAKFVDPNNVGQESTKEDYTLVEDTAAAYFMAEFQLSEKSSIIAGARYEETDFTSTGYLAIRNDRFELPNDSTKLDIAIPLEGARSKYDDIFPSIHYRYDMSDEVLVRASLWTSFTRPSFDQARAFAEIDGRVVLCDPVDDVCNDDPASNGASSAEDVKNFTLAPNNTLNFGNPALVAMTSTNFDASIAWYADEDLFLQAAIFYKDIDDFVIRVNGDTLSLDELPIQLPVDQIDQFIIPADLELTQVNWSTNGDKAKVYGIELSYSQYFESGLFVQSNVTLMDSEAKVGDSIRAGDIQLPEQADQTANLTFGWENDDISVRLIGNYRSKILERIGSCPEGAATVSTCKDWADVYHDQTIGMDFKAIYQVTDMINVYFDALNVTDENAIRYFEGNSDSLGNSLFSSEAYGRSYQLGINVSFM